MGCLFISKINHKIVVVTDVIVMNRREFFKSIVLGTPVVTCLSLSSMSFQEPLHKQFDWVCTPASLAFRIEKRKNGYHSLISRPFVNRTFRLKIVTPKNIDLTKEKIIINKLSYHQDVIDAWNRDSKDRGYPLNHHKQTIYTNEILLNECKQLKLTHLYAFTCYEDITCNWYIARGCRLPGWETINGKLQIVDV